MKRTTIVLMVLFCCGTGLPAAARAEGKPQEGRGTVADIEGHWLGVVSVQGMKLRLGLRVSRDSAGKRTATLDSLDQGAKDLPVEEIEQSGQTVRFSARRLGLIYSGSLSADGRRIEGEMKQGTATLPLTFERVAVVPRLERPQEPVRPFPYQEQEVSCKNGAITLAGTLTVPEGKGPHPAVLLLTGSGAQDRDETIAGHRPFYVLADYLTRRGVAVLRMDDRGVGKSTGGSPDDTSETFAGDALAAVEYLRQRPEIDSRRIGLIGHSEGGIIAAMAGARSKAVAFVVMMAGMGQTGEEVILSQTELSQRAYGVDPEMVSHTRDTLKKIFTALRSEPDARAAVQKMRGVLDAQTNSLSEKKRNGFAGVSKTLQGQLGMYTTGWFRYFVGYDPASDLRKVTVPVLAVTGELDLQAPANENLKKISAAMNAGGNRDVTARELARLNHLFQTARTGLPNEYSEIEETIAPMALEMIGDWVAQRAFGLLDNRRRP